MSTFYDFSNSHGVLKSCLNEDLLMDQVLKKQCTGLEKMMDPFVNCSIKGDILNIYSRNLSILITTSLVWL